MLGFDPRVARATWTVIGIGLLCLATYAIRQTLFMFVVALIGVPIVLAYTISIYYVFRGKVKLTEESY